MKKKFMAVSLLFSSLFLVPGCEWLKKAGCKTCQPTEQATEQTGITSNQVQSDDTSQPLLVMDGKTYATVNSFEEFYEDYLKSDPRIAAAAAFIPNLREELFKNNYVLSIVIEEWTKRSGKINDPEYKQKLQKAVQLATRAVAMQAFEEAVLQEIDTSDEALKKFYEENKESADVFKQAPFVTQQAGVKAISVAFDSEQAANDFAQKVKDAAGDLSTVAQQADKEVKDLGVVTNQSQGVNPVLRQQVAQMELGAINVIKTGKDEYTVVKALEKQEAEYAPFNDVKDSVKQAMLQSKGSKLFMQKLDDLKKEYNVKENLEFFTKEREEKDAMNAQLDAAAEPEAENQQTEEAEATVEQSQAV